MNQARCNWCVLIVLLCLSGATCVPDFEYRLLSLIGCRGCRYVNMLLLCAELPAPAQILTHHTYLARATHCACSSVWTISRMRIITLLSPAKTLNWAPAPASLAELCTQPKMLKEADPVVEASSSITWFMILNWATAAAAFALITDRDPRLGWLTYHSSIYLYCNESHA